jgi:hypothetical protein
MKPVESARTIYPRLPDVPDEETLAAVTTVEGEEGAFSAQAGNPRHQYLRILYLKAMAYLGHSRFQPGEVSRLIRLRLADELNLSREFANILKIQPVEKSRIVADVREFLGINLYTQAVRTEVETWLKEGAAREEGDLLPVINAAIRWFTDKHTELLSFQVVTVIAETALNAADEHLQEIVSETLDENVKKKLDSFLMGKGGQTPLDRFKAEVRAPSPTKIQFELNRLKELEDFSSKAPVLRTLSRRKVESFAEIGKRYHAPELRQLRPSRRRLILLCYLMVRRAQLLDAAAELFIQIWKNTHATAKNHANMQRQLRADAQEQHELVLQELLDIICDSVTDYELARQIRTYRTPEDYENLRREVRKGISWNEYYYHKVRDHYAALRRFLPDWYEVVPLITTTADDSLLKAMKFLKEHADPKDTALPASGYRQASFLLNGNVVPLSGICGMDESLPFTKRLMNLE